MRQLAPDAFPPLLREIPDRPKALYVRGELPSPAHYIYLCVVGSRAASVYGRRVCASLISGLSGMPIAIVSGLALGMDADAHKAALAAGLPTVGVLAALGEEDSSIYPAFNRQLGISILEKGGALVSEYRHPVQIARWSFPARDRIMAGLCRATLIIEAGEKSGTLVTARLALDYNRELLAVPHALGTENGAGANRLIREGAALIRHSDDLLAALGLSRAAATERILPADLTEHEVKVFASLTEPMDKDALIARTQMEARHANIALSSLLIRGLIIERLGKIERS